METSRRREKGMKALIGLLLTFVLLLTGCTHVKKTQQETEAKFPNEITEIEQPTETALDLNNMSKIRNQEVLKAYPMGRYIDPNNPNIMHEEHVVYRMEEDASWNLRSNAPTAVPMGDTIAIACPEKEPQMSDKEVQAQYGGTMELIKHLMERNQQLMEMVANQEAKLNEMNLRLTESMNSQKERGRKKRSD